MLIGDTEEKEIEHNLMFFSYNSIKRRNSIQSFFSLKNHLLAKEKLCFLVQTPTMLTNSNFWKAELTDLYT